MSFVRQWLLHNWTLKVVALGLSFLLWATYTAEPYAEAGYIVPLGFTNIPKNLEISGDVPTQVHVRVRGHPGLLRRLSPVDLDVSVDLSGAHPGDTVYQLSPDQVVAPYGATVVRIAPAEVHVLLVSRQTSSAAR